MTPIQKTRNQKVIAALKNNKKKAQKTMRRPNGGRCCLCVSEDAAIEDGLKIRKCPPTTNEYNSIEYPQSETVKYLGWGKENPDIKVLPEFFMEAAQVNDSKLNVPHRIIAEFFANTFTRKKFKLSPEARVYANRLKNKVENWS